MAKAKAMVPRIDWHPYSENLHQAWVQGEKGAYEIWANIRFPDDPIRWHFAIEMARDPGDSGWIVLADESGTSNESGSARVDSILSVVEARFLQFDTVVRNISRDEYEHWIEDHPGREGYRPDDWVMYARPRGSKSKFMPYDGRGRTKTSKGFAPGFLLKEADVNRTTMRTPDEGSVRRWMEDVDPESDYWQYEARSGVGEKERRIRSLNRKGRR